jgi:hypothetical protein
MNYTSTGIVIAAAAFSAAKIITPASAQPAPLVCDAQCKAQQATISELTQAWVSARTALVQQQDNNLALSTQLKKVQAELEAAEHRVQHTPEDPAPAKAPAP